MWYNVSYQQCMITWMVTLYMCNPCEPSQCFIEHLAINILFVIPSCQFLTWMIVTTRKWTKSLQFQFLKKTGGCLHFNSNSSIFIDLAQTNFLFHTYVGYIKTSRVLPLLLLLSKLWTWVTVICCGQAEINEPRFRQTKNRLIFFHWRWETSDNCKG